MKYGLKYQCTSEERSNKAQFLSKFYVVNKVGFILGLVQFLFFTLKVIKGAFYTVPYRGKFLFHLVDNL